MKPRAIETEDAPEEPRPSSGPAPKTPTVAAVGEAAHHGDAWPDWHHHDHDQDK
jgi:hypothetical protein